MCKKWESSTANIIESAEKALNAAEAVNDRHNVEVFKKSLKVVQGAFGEGKGGSEGSRGSDKRHGREIDAN